MGPPPFQYLKMYNATEILTGFAGLVGWRQNIDPAGVQVAAGLTASSSGIYYNGVHPLLTFDNIKAIAPEFSRISGLVEATAFNTWLQQKTDEGIIAGINRWIESKFEVKTARALIEREQVFYYGPGQVVAETPDADFVGLEILPVESLGMRITIERIGLNLTDAQDIEIKLFHSDQNEPTESDTLSYGATGQEWFDLGWTLDATGTHWIGYDSGAISGAWINGINDFNFFSNGAPWIARNGRFCPFPAFRNFAVSPFRAHGSDGAVLWDLRNNRYTLSTNYGLNLVISVNCDYTDFLISQRSVLKNVIAQAVGYSMLRELAANPQALANRKVANTSRSELMFELQGKDGKGGVVGTYAQAVEAANMNFEGNLDRKCLPCMKWGVKWKSPGYAKG